MTVKVNRMIQSPRIIIDVAPDGTTSTLTVQGHLTMPAVVLTLISQLNSVAPKMLTEIFQLSGGMVNAQGTPLVTRPAGTMEVTYPEDEQKAIQDERAGKVV